MSTVMDIEELRTQASVEELELTRGRPARATLTLGTAAEELPVATELAALLSWVPVAGVRLAQPADFSTLSEDAIVRVIASLRECSSIGAQVGWSLILEADQVGLVPKLDHLPPPDSITVRGTGSPPVNEWRSSRSFGLLYFRKGPKFLSVVDRRSGATDRIVLDDPTVIDVFLRGLEGFTWPDVAETARASAAARDLVDRGMIMRVGNRGVTLPVHMRSWPIGAAMLGGTLASAGKKVDASPE